MRTVKEIYEHYRIPSWLQSHQLRVTAVATLAARNFQGDVDERDAVYACLFHDMGNILKFDLAPDGPLVPLFGKENIGYLQAVKDDFQARYGTDEHAASIAIAHEIGLPENAIAIIDTIGFSNVHDLFEKGSKELWVSQYADMRVGPFGIISLKARIDDLKHRYAHRSKWFGDAGSADANERILTSVEERLFAGSPIRPDDIHDAAAAPLIEELWDYPLA